MYPVYLTLGDPAKKAQLHQSLEYLSVVGAVELAVTADRRGYRLGEQASFTVSAASKTPWTGELYFGIYDYRGRLLEQATQPVTLNAERQELPFRHVLTDQGVRTSTLWAQVVARRDGKEWGRADTKIYNYEPWSMRNEYQWSTWARFACSPSSTVPRAMRLMAHAGMNSLGYPGRNELHYAAERWGWRYYNEGIGMNTFSPVIEYENDEEIEAMLLQQAKQSAGSRDLYSGAFIFGSVGEEAGFNSGWGTRYYWPTPVAPDKACRAFQWYLKNRYPDLATLNSAWQTKFQSWDDIKLTKEFSVPNPTLDADGWAHPKESPLGSDVARVSPAPYADTEAFYNWYYDRIVDRAIAIFHDRFNPATLAISSAPAIGSGQYDVRQSGPNLWYDSQWHGTQDGPEPGFSLVWGHFDQPSKTSDLFWGFLLTRGGHNNFWVNTPLMFNTDLTHTRASFAMRRWTHQLAGHERILLDSRPLPTDAAMLVGPSAVGVDAGLLYTNMASSIKVALAQGGFALPSKDTSDLRKYKIVFAIGRERLSQRDALRLEDFVRQGGTLCFVPSFASQDELGLPQGVSPGWGLADRWGLRVTEAIHPHGDGASVTFRFNRIDHRFQNAVATSWQAGYREQVQTDGWQQLASYDDDRPAVLTRTLGQGRLVYLNAVYASHHYIQSATSTGPERQGFFKLDRVAGRAVCSVPAADVADRRSAG